MSEEKHASEGRVDGVNGDPGPRPGSGASRRRRIPWFTDGEFLRPAQRWVFGVLSLLFAAGGLLLARDFIGDVRAGNWGFWIAGLGSMICLVVGVTGLRNALRFGRDAGGSERVRG